MPSLVAEIGDVIESHMRMIGMLRDDAPDEHQQRLINEKRAQFEEQIRSAEATELNAEDSFPAEATLCPKCQTKAVILMDGCETCLNCGNSKCG